MTAFHEVRFPDDIAYGSSGGPEYSTDVIITASGFEQRNINWQDARAVYNVAHGVKTQEQLSVLISFFRARKGRAYGFRFKDWSDYKVTHQEIGVSDGVSTIFQLTKIYESGGVKEIRPVHKIVDNSVDIYVDNILKTSEVTVNYNNGEIVFAKPPAISAIITASFEFDVPVRFGTDRLSASLEAYGVNSWLNIPLVEVRLF